MMEFNLREPEYYYNKFGRKSEEDMEAGKTEDIREKILSTDYSFVFDKKRQDLIVQSHFKYGKASRNFATGNVDAIGSLKKCLDKFEETHNTEYLLDVANYAMFRYMYPQNGEFFKSTDSDGSAGIVGMSVTEMEQYMESPK